MSKLSAKSHKRFKTQGAFGNPVSIKSPEITPVISKVKVGWKDKLKFNLLVIKIRVLAFIRRIFQ